MANEQLQVNNYSYASIDSAPGAAGYWCKPVSMGHKKAKALFFSWTGGGTGTVTLQFSTPDAPDTWTDYVHDETLENGVRLIMDDHAMGVKWRAGVKQGGLTAGTIKVGFDWS